MDIAAWIIQILLALAFALAGWQKIVTPTEKFPEAMVVTRNLSVPVRRTVGVLEVAAAVGLILPMLTGILPILTPLAAAGLILTMIGAIFANISARQYSSVGINLVFIVLSAFVIYARFVALPVV